MFMELYREEKKEEGDRGGQEDKEGNQKEKIPHATTKTCTAKKNKKWASWT